MITSGVFTHEGSIQNLLGENPDVELQQHISLEKNVTRETPPVFIWHTMEDPDVPVENALLFVNSLRKNQIPVEFHLYTYGVHGLSLATKELEEPEKKRFADAHVASWHSLSTGWLKRTLSVT